MNKNHCGLTTEYLINKNIKNVKNSLISKMRQKIYIYCNSINT